MEGVGRVSSCGITVLAIIVGQGRKATEGVLMWEESVVAVGMHVDEGSTLVLGAGGVVLDAVRVRSRQLRMVCWSAVIWSILGSGVDLVLLCVRVVQLGADDWEGCTSDVGASAEVAVAWTST